MRPLMFTVHLVLLRHSYLTLQNNNATVFVHKIVVHLLFALCMPSEMLSLTRTVQHNDIEQLPRVNKVAEEKE